MRGRKQVDFVHNIAHPFWYKKRSPKQGDGNNYPQSVRPPRRTIKKDPLNEGTENC